MCLGPEIALIASAAGAGLSAVGQRNALRDQDREVARGIRANAAISRQASQRVGQEIDKVSAASPDADAAAGTTEFMNALRRAQMQDGGDSFSTTGKVSDRFAEDVGAARAGARAEGASTASNLARIDAPGRLRTREGTGFNNTAVDLSMLASRAQGEDFMSRLRAAMITPKHQELGGFLSGLGSTLATRAPGGAKAPKRPGTFESLPPQLPRLPHTDGIGGGIYG